MDREGDDDRPDRLDVLNWVWGRNVGKTPAPQTALWWALADLWASRDAKRQTKRYPNSQANSEAKPKYRRLRMCSHAQQSKEARKWSPPPSVDSVPHASPSNRTGRCPRRSGQPPCKRGAKLVREKISHAPIQGDDGRKWSPGFGIRSKFAPHTYLSFEAAKSGRKFVQDPRDESVLRAGNATIPASR